MGETCDFVAEIKPGLLSHKEKTENIRAYAFHILSYLNDYAYEELGDEIPANVHTIITECSETFDGTALHGADAYRITSSALRCIQRQYLGLCARDDCADRPAMLQMIHQLPAKNAVQF